MRKILCHKKGFSLIVVIFGMVLLAALGWTLSVIVSGDMDAGLRNLDSERAFAMAEAGEQWVARQVNSDPAFRTDSAHGFASGYAEHTLPFDSVSGQYRVTCLDGTGADAGKTAISSTGYFPAQANYRAMRQVKILMVPGGGLSKGVSCGGTFNWSAAKAGHTVTIDADISAANYNGDGNATFNQLNSDYGTNPLLPAGSGARLIRSGGTTIPMQWYHDNADCEWPSPGTRVITNTAANTSTGNRLRVTSPSGFFTGMLGQAVRNVDHPALADGSWADADWAVITVVNSDLDVTLDKTIGENWDGHKIRLARRYSDTTPLPPAPESGRNDSGGAGSGINYIGATITHNMGYVVDTIIDLRSDALSWGDVKIVCEGDIFIKGSYALTMTHSSSGGSGGSRHPPLATQNGNIICLDATTANNRVISGLIFSESGTVNWNYLKHPTSGASWLRGNMIYGKNIILDGDITINWLPALSPPGEAQFGAGVGSFSWQEQ